MIVDCMACLVAMSRGRLSDGMFRDGGGDGVTHATHSHFSYGMWRGVLCTYRSDGQLRLVPK